MGTSTPSQHANRILGAMVSSACDRAAGITGPSDPTGIELLVAELADLDEDVQAQTCLLVASRAVSAMVSTGVRSALADGVPIAERVHSSATTTNDLEGLMTNTTTPQARGKVNRNGYTEACIGAWPYRTPCTEMAHVELDGRHRCIKHWRAYTGVRHKQS